MNVKILLFVKFRFYPQNGATTAHHGPRRFDGLLHHIAQMAGAYGLALARHHHRLDSQQVAACFSPGQARHLPYPVFFLGAPVAEFLDAD